MCCCWLTLNCVLSLCIDCVYIIVFIFKCVNICCDCVTGSVLVIEAEHNNNNSNDSRLTVHFNGESEPVDLGFFSEHLRVSHQNNSVNHRNVNSLYRVLDRNDELLVKRRDALTHESSLCSLRELSDCLKTFVHVDR